MKKFNKKLKKAILLNEVETKATLTALMYWSVDSPPDDVVHTIIPKFNDMLLQFPEERKFVNNQKKREYK